MSKPTLGVVVDQLWQTRESLRALSQQEKDLKARYDELKSQIISMLNELGTDQARTNKATVTVTEQEVMGVDDWDAFYGYVHDNQAYHLLQRRPASRAIIEESEAEGPVPGTKPFTKIDIGLRTNT